MEDATKWYQKKRWIGAAIAGVILVVAGGQESATSTDYVAPVVNTSSNSSSTVPKPASVPKQVSKPTTRECHPNYSGCLNPNASDYDCAGGSGNGPYYTGVVRVIGSDVFDLDRDGDGVGCE